MPPDDNPLIIRQLSRRIPRTALRAFLGELTKRVARARSIVCLITDDRELRSLNRRFRGKNSTTDVLSFPSEPFPSEPFPSDLAANASGIGEIAISLDRAAAQAVEHGHSLADELRILMLHGTLHLKGFDHETDSGEMSRAESRWRKRLGLPNGLIERTNSAITKRRRKQ